MPEKRKKAVIEAGLFAIEQSGDTMKIDVPEGFVPSEWWLGERALSSLS